MSGIIDLGSAVNELMLEDIASWTRWNLKKSELKDGLGYNDTQGSPELLKAAADFMNEHFNARIPLTSDNILVANGATTLLDTLTYNIADEGDSILLPTPSYGMFAHDISTRNQDFGLGGLRIGFLATYNQEIHDTMRTLSMFGWVSSYSATIAAKLLSDKKYFRDHYTPTFNRRLKKRRILVEGELDKYDIPYMKADSGFFMFVDLSDWMDLLFAQHGKDGELELLEHLMENGVFLEPGKMILGLGIPSGGTRRVAATLVNGRHMPGLRPPELVRWHDSIAVIPRCEGFG
ncbi:1-aminocyclopropane-1-carboxylate synthase-like protein 1 [Colletotrichum sp. SAR 10_96]|nr:1-aminocyclopropane-1-carboxylate synthase-like protein 1 [Colletotrichum sp. SAR 10_96]